MGLLDYRETVVVRIITEQQAELKRPLRTMGELLSTLQEDRLIQSVAKLRELRAVARISEFER